MSMFTTKLADGYALSLTDGYGFTSAWQDIHSSPFYSMSVVFSGGNPQGTLSLQMSNDQNAREAGYTWSAQQSPVSSGSVNNNIPGDFPYTAGGPYGTANDAQTISGSSQSITTSGTYVYNTDAAGYRWVRVLFTANSNVNCNIDIWFHRKSQRS